MNMILTKILTTLRKIGGVYGVAIILTIVFTILRFLNVIKWNWLWVLSPLWILIGIIILAVIIIYAWYFIVSIATKIKYQRRFNEFKRRVDAITQKK